MALTQILIAADQLLNTLIPPYSGSSCGWADETLSSRCWRLSGTSKIWKVAQTTIDYVASAVFGQTDHCFESWMSERLRMQMPPELRMDTPNLVP